MPPTALELQVKCKGRKATSEWAGDLGRLFQAALAEVYCKASSVNARGRAALAYAARDIPAAARFPSSQCLPSLLLMHGKDRNKASKGKPARHWDEEIFELETPKRVDRVKPPSSTLSHAS